MGSKYLSNIYNQKKKYLFLVGIVVVGIIFGIVFSLIISKSDKLVVTSSIRDLFTTVKDGNIKHIDILKESLFSNSFYLFLVWLLGMSIIGLPIILFMLFTRGFILGFSIGGIISTYGYKGIIGALLFIFPHQLISMIISILLTYYALIFSVRLFKYLFLYKNINFKFIMKRYIKILLLCLVGFVICSFLEVYVSPILLNIFNKII